MRECLRQKYPTHTGQRAAAATSRDPGAPTCGVGSESLNGLYALLGSFHRRDPLYLIRQRMTRRRPDVWGPATGPSALDNVAPMFGLWDCLCRGTTGTVPMPPLLGARPDAPTVAALYVQKNGCYFGLSER